MANKKTPLYWHGGVVGFIHDVKVDMFHRYGRWEQVDSEHAKKFLEAVEESEGEDATLGDGERAVQVVAGRVQDGEMDVTVIVKPRKS